MGENPPLNGGFRSMKLYHVDVDDDDDDDDEDGDDEDAGGGGGGGDFIQVGTCYRHTDILLYMDNSPW